MRAVDHWQHESLLRSASLFFRRLLSPEAAVGFIEPKTQPYRMGTVAADPVNPPEFVSAFAHQCELSLSDMGAVARRIGDVFGVDPGSLRFMRLQASMLFRGDDGWVYRVPAKDHVREGFFAERDLMALLAP